MRFPLVTASYEAAEGELAAKDAKRAKGIGLTTKGTKGTKSRLGNRFVGCAMRTADLGLSLAKAQSSENIIFLNLGALARENLDPALSNKFQDRI